jgi:hypothetical protein
MRVCRALIKEQARKELEREQQTEAEIEKLKSVYGEKEPEVKEAPEQAGYSRHDNLLKGHGNEADFLGFLHKPVWHRSLTLRFEPFRF